MLVQKQFIDLVDARQPRALVMLAPYFKLLGRFNMMWWISDTGQTEIRGIHSALSDDRRRVMDWSLRSMEDWLLL